MSGLADPEIVLVSKGKISHFVTLCITNFKEFSRWFYQKRRWFLDAYKRKTC